MFQITCQSGKPQIRFGETGIVRGMTVAARLNDGREIPLALKDQAEHRLTFADADDTVTAELIFRAGNDVLLAFVNACVKNEHSFGTQRYLAGEHGVIIRLEGAALEQGGLAIYQHKDWWTRPGFVRSAAELPPRTQSLFWRQDGGCVYLLPVSGGPIRADLQGGPEAIGLVLSTYRDGFHRYETLAFALGAGPDPFALARRTVAAALAAMPFAAFHRDEKTYPEVFEYLGWCSWDAFYQKVNADGLTEKMAELHGQGLPVKWVMIDDGWSDVRDGRLNAFEADADKFPDGLSAPVRRMKEQYGVRWVGVWHTIMGYWSGIEPTSPLAMRYKEYLYETRHGKLIPYPDASRAFGFWNAWHAYLRRQGIDFVKVDGQSSVFTMLKYDRPIGEAAREAHTALEASVALHFDRTIINCMGMGAENIWNRPVTSVSRNSDDFVPQEERSFREHALQNVYNSLYHGQFYWGDWDMFWTIHPDALPNSVLRAVSGGPVYISDPVGRTDPDLIRPLVFRDGRIVRGDRPGLPTLDCLFRNPWEHPAPLKVWNTANGAGFVAAFHIHKDPSPLRGELRPADVPDLKGDRFVLYDYFGRTARRLARHEAHAFELTDGGVALFIIVPADEVFRPVGLMDKYIPPAAIEQTWSSGRRYYVRLREGGLFGFVSDRPPAGARVNGEAAPVEAMDAAAGLYAVDGSKAEAEMVVEIEI